MIGEIIESIQGHGPLGVSAVLFIVGFLLVLIMPQLATGAFFAITAAIFVFAIIREYGGDLSINFR